MKKIILLHLCLLLMLYVSAQKPSKEQMEKDKKAYAEAMKKLDERLAKMDPKAKKAYDSLMNSLGAGAKINEYKQAVNTNAGSKKAKSAIGLVPAKNAKAIAAIGATPTNAGMGSLIGLTSNSVLSAVLPAAKSKANEIYKAMKANGTTTDEMGNAATALWMNGRTQIALSLMAQVCKDNGDNSDNLNNYAAMLTMTGAPELAIPILYNLNKRFKKNSTILNI